MIERIFNCPWYSHSFLRVGVVGLGLLLLSGCEHGNQEAAQVSVDGSSLSVAIPRIISSVREIDFDKLVLQARVDEQQFELRPNRDKTEWSGTISVPENQVVTLSLRWLEDTLPLAALSREIGPLNGNQELTLDAADFDSDQFDDDNDSYSNLFEVKEELDPLDADVPGAENLDIVVPWISPSDAPTIDGLYDQIWSSSRFRDVRNEILAINNLMIDTGGGRAEDEVEFQWSTLHDGTYFYIFVYGEEVEGAALYGDSDDGRQDDALNIFIDGDNSKQRSYDGADDFHIIIPMLKGFDDTNGAVVGNNSIDGDARLQAGEQSAPLPASIRFANCVCNAGQHTWEVRLHMDDLGIKQASAFGLEIQLDDDIDGGARDARWGWKHPSRSAAGDVNGTESDPSLMGTAYLD